MASIRETADRAGQGRRPGPEDPVELISQKLNSNWMTSARAMLEKQWLKCVAYAKGVQHEKYGIFQSTLARDETSLRPRDRRRRDRYITNQIKPFLKRRMAQLISAPPGWECQPVSTDYSDRPAAELGMDCLNHLYYNRRFYQKFGEAAWWTSVTGFTAIRPAWHGALGEPREIFFNPENNEPLPDEVLHDPLKEALRAKGYSTMVPTGELTLKVFSPFQIVMPPSATEDYCPWTIEIEVVHVDELYDLYPNDTELIHQAHRGTTAANKSPWMENLIRAHGMLGPLAGYAEAYDDEEHVVVKRMFYRPCKRYPEGRYIVESGGLPLVDGTNPYLEFGIMQPHVWFTYSIEGGHPYSSGLVEDLVRPNNALNDVRDARIENTRLMGNPKWLVPASCGVDRISNRHGSVVKFKGPTPPQPMKIDPIDNAGEQLNQTLIQDMQNLGFQQDVTQAKVPSNLRSGVAISLLQERDDAGITPVVRAWDRAVALVGDHCLKMIAKLWPDQKAIRVYGEDQSWDVRYFRRGVLDGKVIVVTPEERRTPTSRTLEMQKIFEGLEMGIIDPTDPLTRQEALRSMNLGGGWEKVLRAQQLNQRRARMENEIFAELGPQGEGWPSVEVWEDHSMHLAVHNELRLTDRWEALDAEIKLVLDAHCRDHENYLKRQQQEQLAMMEAARGGPGPKGRASQPAKQ